MPRRRGWPDRRRPARPPGIPVVPGRSRRGNCATCRLSTRPRTGRLPTTRRNSRAGTCRRPRTCSAPCRGWRIRLARPRPPPRLWSARRAGSTAVRLGSGRAVWNPAPGRGRADQRPATVGSVLRDCGCATLYRLRRGGRRPGAPARNACERRCRASSARTGANVSPVTQPAQISSHSAALSAVVADPALERAGGRSTRHPRPGCPGSPGGRR